MVEIFQASGLSVELKAGLVKKFKGTRLPGAQLFQAEQGGYTISIHNAVFPSFSLSLRSINCSQAGQLIIKEASSILRIEAILTGQMETIDSKGIRHKLLAGQYRFTSERNYALQFENTFGFQCFVAFLGSDLIDQPAFRERLNIGEVKGMSVQMREIIDRMLVNPFENNFRDWFYDNSVRELLFRHASLPPNFLPGELTPTEIAAVHEADRIIASNLNKHYTIHELARMVRTNAFTLKTAFARVMGVGMFERLQDLKMERAKELLSSTDLQIQVVSDMAGYETVTGFINSFRKQFGMTPKDWRKKSRGTLD